MLSVVAGGCGRQPGRGKEGGRDEGRKGVLRSRKKKKGGKRRRSRMEKDKRLKKINKKKIMKSMLCFGPTVLHLMLGILRKRTGSNWFNLIAKFSCLAA